MKIMISPADDEEEEIIIKCSALTADLLAGSHFDKCSTRSISTSRVITDKVLFWSCLSVIKPKSHSNLRTKASF